MGDLPTITAMPPWPTRSEAADIIAAKITAVFQAMPTHEVELEVFRVALNNYYLTVLIDLETIETNKNTTTEARSQSQQYAITCEQALSDVVVNKLLIEELKQDVIDVASGTSALDLADANKFVKRQKAKQFGLNLL